MASFMVSEFVAGILLAIIQGIAEWFPISSSGHLVLASHLLGFENSLAFDIALHFGTLMAVFVYFGKDITEILRDLLRLRFNSENGRLGLYVIVAAMPAAIVGLIFRDFFETNLNNLGLLALGLAINGVFLFIASLDFRHRRELSWLSAVGVGLFQIASLFRGISRSGSTIGGGVLLGLDQRKAARFSFLLSIPIIFGANLLTLGGNEIPSAYFIPALVSFGVGLASIHVLLKFVLTSKKNLRWFGAYTLALAMAISLWLLLS